MLASRLLTVAIILCRIHAAWATPAWDVETFRGADTIEMKTNVPGEGEYWFPIWVVVIEDEAYVRLGSQAAARFQKNDSFPEVAIRVNGQQFDRVRGEPVPTYAGAVDTAMAEKYWTDLIIRWFPHPMILRLVPVGSEPPAP